MDYNLKKFAGRKGVTLLILVSMISSTVYAPIFSPRARAAGLPVADVPQIIRAATDALAMIFAKKVVDNIVKSSISWANSGFEGDPAYVTDPGQYFGNIANETAGGYLNELTKTDLCAPFRPQIVVSLADYYKSEYLGGLQPVSQCTFTGITGNLEDFYSDFSAGGWEGWFSMTQNSSNNPYALYLDVQSGLDGEIAAKIDIEGRKIDWGQGFKSLRKCLVTNPPASEPHHVSSKPVGECIEYGPDVTPGATIKSQIDKVLPSGLEKLITVEHLEQLVGAFAEGLLNRYVFGPKGLFASDYSDHFNQSSDGPSLTADQAEIDRIIQESGGLQPWPTDDDDDNDDNDDENNNNNGGTAQLSCSPNKEVVVVKEDTVTWGISSNLNPGTTYLWSGEMVGGAAGTSITVMYGSEGTKTASVQATIPTSNTTFTTMTVGCSSSVMVVPNGGNGGFEL